MRAVSVFLLAGCSLMALPSGMQVVSGSAKSEAGGGELSVSCSDRTILQWDSFSIGASERAQFLFDGNGAVLNRVMGGSVSEILGLMQSNGQLYLINPNGVLIGPDARIESAGFLASTLDVLNDDFLAKSELLFAGSSNGAILNLGTIACPQGDVALFARFVKNEGTIEAKEGAALMASAPEILLKHGRVFIKPDLAAESKEDGTFSVENTGKVEALAVELKSGASPYLQAIRNAGTIRSVARVEEGGVVYLVAEQGYTEMSGSIEAGEVRVLGDCVALLDGAKIDASRDEKGGTVLIGGSFQGRDSSVKEARVTLIQEGVEIQADALEHGDGGQVVVWSGNTTGFYGKISAQGGSLGGDGGDIEVSGPQLFYAGVCTTAAPQGAFGSLLLDPNDITISTAATTNIATAWTPHPVYYDGFPPGSATPNLNTGDLVTSLNLNNVLVQSDDTLGGVGSVSILNDITGWTAATQLTIRASGQLLIGPNVAISNTSTGTAGAGDFTAIYFIANQGNVFTGAGPGIQLNDSTITTVAGHVYLNGKGGPTGSNNKGVEIAASGTTSGIFTTSGSITLIGEAGRMDGLLVSNNYGVHIHGVVGMSRAEIVTDSGNVTIQGTAQNTRLVPTMENDNQGVLIDSNGFVLSGPGDANSLVLIEGIAGPGKTSGGGATANCNGIQISNNSAVSVDQGSIRMVGQGNGSNDNNNGIFIYNSGLVTSTGLVANGSSIVLEGTGSMLDTAVDSNCGISIEFSNTGFGIASVDKDISLIGYGGASAAGSNNHGINISNDAMNNGPGEIVSTGSANISLTGYAAAPGVGSPNSGVSIANSLVAAAAPMVSATGAGSIVIYGESRSPSSPAIQVTLNTGAAATSGTISLNGLARGTGNFCPGVYIEDALIQTTATGNIEIYGEGSPSGTDTNPGVLLSFSAAPVGNIIQVVDGDIHITGVAGGSGSGNTGVLFQTLGSQMVVGTGLGVSPAAGSLFITGTGGSGASALPANNGIYVHGLGAGAAIRLNTDSGSINLVGKGGTDNGAFGNCDGILFDQFSAIVSNTGDISLYGEAISGNASNAGINLQNTVINSPGAAPGAITLTGIGSPNGTDSNAGILINTMGRGFGIQSLTKDLYLTGSGGGTGTDNIGISMSNLAFMQSTGSSAFYLEGTGGKGTDHNTGITFTGGPVIVLTTDGNLSLLGIGNGTGVNNYGVEFTAAAFCQTSGTGSLQIDGRGSITGSSNNIGITFTNCPTAALTLNQDQYFKAAAGGGTATAMLLDTSKIQTNGTSRGVNIQTTSLDHTGGDLVMLHQGALIQTVVSGTEYVILDIARDLSLSDGAGITTALFSATTGRDFLIDGNGLTSTGVCGVATGTISPLVPGNMDIVVGRDLTLIGGSAANQLALLYNSSGLITFTTGRDVTLQAGAGSLAGAQIGGIFGDGSILSPYIGGNVTLTGDAWASIGYSNPAMSSPGAPNNSGSISLLNILGDLTLRGGPLAGGFAQIGHINPAAGPAVDLSGDIFINVAGNVFFNDANTAAGTYSQIGHGGPSGGVATFTGTGAVEVHAGGSFSMAGIAGQAIITNPSTTGSGTYPASGSITLVADNANPLNPFVGANTFSMNATSTISNNRAASGGQVRIYTAQQNVAAIVPGQMINGAVYMASAMPGVNTAYENFDIYYGGGQYIGPEFALYYKLPFVINPICPTCPVCPSGGACPVEVFLFFPQLYRLAVAEAEFNDLFPLIPTQPHHCQICTSSAPGTWTPGLPCVPGFSRFESFVFENTVDHILPFQED